MNFLDAYGIAGPSTAPPAQSEQSLNEEVSEVMGQIGRLWGGFRKQSQTAFQTAVTQAQKELGKLAGENQQSAAETEVHSPHYFDPATTSTALNPDSTDPQGEDPTVPTSSDTLLSRFQSAFPPNIVTTVTSHLPETLKHASENIDFTHLGTTLSAEFQRVQGATRSQAEDYMHKSEILLREAVKEAGEVLRDAVKIVPPDNESSGLVWDGTDMWSLPYDSPDTTPPNKGPASQRGVADAELAVATRAEALFKRLKHDPAIVRHDPEADPDLRELYHQWTLSEVDTKEGGINGDELSTRISKYLDEHGSGLKETRDILVPSELTSDVFWMRFLFRAHQIEVEEEKRKLLIKEALDEEDFSWEDDEDDTVPTPDNTIRHTTPRQSNPAIEGLTARQPTAGTFSKPTSNPTSSSASLDTLDIPKHTQDGSEESYDLISSRITSPSLDNQDNSVDESDEQDSDWE